MFKVYTLSNCETCRAATKWLRQQNIPFEEQAIRDTPPSLPELRAALAASSNEPRKLFNTSGRDFREQKLADKLPGMTIPAALSLLAQNGNLVKRPFLVGDGVTLVGFRPEAWESALLGRK